MSRTFVVNEARLACCGNRRGQCECGCQDRVTHNEGESHMYIDGVDLNDIPTCNDSGEEHFVINGVNLMEIPSVGDDLICPLLSFNDGGWSAADAQYSGRSIQAGGEERSNPGPRRA